MNKRYENLDKGFYDEGEKSLIERISGAKKVITGVALVATLVGSVAVGLDASCHKNDPTNFICPITRLETMLFGYEAGLKHQAQDLEGYVSTYDAEWLDESVVENVEYSEGGTRYYAPDGGVLTKDEAGEMVVEQTVAASATTIYGPDGEAQVIYTVPSGYVLEGTVGVKKTHPLAVEESASVQYDYNFVKDGEVLTTYEESWSYEDGEFVRSSEVKGKTR